MKTLPESAVLCCCLVIAAGCTQMNVRRDGDLEALVALREEARTAYAGEDWEVAAKAYTRLVNQVPAEAENWFRLGNAYVHLERYNDALRMYSEALVRDPHHARAWHNLGIAQLRMATNTFVEMQKYTDSDDPAAERARRIVDAVTRVLEEPAAEEAPQE